MKNLTFVKRFVMLFVTVAVFFVSIVRATEETKPVPVPPVYDADGGSC